MHMSPGIVRTSLYELSTECKKKIFSVSGSQCTYIKSQKEAWPIWTMAIVCSYVGSVLQCQFLGSGSSPCAGEAWKCRSMSPTSRNTDRVDLKLSLGIFVKATEVILMQSQILKLLLWKAFNIFPLLIRGKGWNEKKGYLLVQPELLSHMSIL